MMKIVEMLIADNVISKGDITELMMDRPPVKISLDNLQKYGLITPEILERFIVDKVKQGHVPLSSLENIKEIRVDRVLEKVAYFFNVNYIDLDAADIDMKIFDKVPYRQLIKYHIMPIKEDSSTIYVALCDPQDMLARDTIQRLFSDKIVSIYLASSKQIKEHLQRIEMNESINDLVGEIRQDLAQQGVRDGTGDSPAILKLIDIIIKSAIYNNASDIHMEVSENESIIRERIDGLLRQSLVLGKDIFSPLSSRMKLLANLDIAEKRKPQDGRFSATIKDKEFDFRVSTLPTMHGESIVLRILDKTKTMIRLEDAGMSKFCYDKFYDAINVPYGIILVTGPTGSGKTTTLYGALNVIKDVKDKIITVEDPVEYQIDGLQQVEVKPKIGLTFGVALKSILRQDPDKIMIGEIRDQETLRIAIQAALTGHLVLSTLHTNDAISAVTRILDMGIEEYLISGSLVAIQAQRLVRNICKHCIMQVDIPSHVLKEISIYLPNKPIFYEGKGCKECQNSGYMGREMISEVLVISEEISRMIARNASKEDLLNKAISEGYRTMFEDGIYKTLEGKTTIQEIYRVARL